jgi:hypothetical protein
MDMEKWRHAMGMVESSNNYNAVGPMVKKGMYAGERALGRYQMMPGNLPQWSKQALGRTVTSNEFLRSPEIQDAIFDYKFAQAAQKHGSFEDAASVWHSGRPLAVAAAAGATDGYMATRDYVKKAVGFLGQNPQGGAYVAGVYEPGVRPADSNNVLGTKAGPAWNASLEHLTQEAAKTFGTVGVGNEVGASGFGDLLGTVKRTLNQTSAGGTQVLQSTAQPVQPMPTIQLNQ